MRRHPIKDGEWCCWMECFGIDVYAMRFWGGDSLAAIGPRGDSGMVRVAYEVKTSRSDFLSELRRPEKRRRAMEISHLFLFATPVGLVEPREIPKECGLVEVDEGAVKMVVRPVVREARWFTESEVIHLLRRDLFRSGAAKLELRLRLLERELEFERKAHRETRTELDSVRGGV